MSVPENGASVGLVVTGRAVDELAQDVHVARVPSRLLEHVHQHPAQRHVLAEPRAPRLLQPDLLDDRVARSPSAGVEGEDVRDRLAG
jgi:hypothetical protein